MLLRREGFPEEGELVFCLVTNVQYNIVFVKIENYERTGLIHISEISPGRIRNIRDYVKEGKMIVCKVIKIDETKGHIDLSLRRVTEIQKRQKTDERKQEQKAEKIIETLATQIKKPVKEVYSVVSKALIPKYGFLQYAFEDLVENDTKFEGLPKDIALKLEEIVKEKISPKVVTINGTLKVTLYNDDGVIIIKNILTKAMEEGSEIKYLGSGKYSVTVTSKDYKSAEKILKNTIQVIQEKVEDSKGMLSFKRKDKE